MVGVGLIGTGFMGKCHAIAWSAVGAVFPEAGRPRLVHLGEVDAHLARRRAEEFGFARASGDWRAVIDDLEVDVVSLTTPNQFHPEMAIAALRAGKHLWCEKPMAPLFADAEAMARAAEASGRVAVLGYNYIQSPAVRHIGALLEEGAIGEVNHLRIEMDEDFMADPDAPFFWKHEATSGYGALDDFAVHPLSLVSVLFGRVARVMCDMARPYADRRTVDGGRRAVETYDIASILMRLESGVSATLQVNRSPGGARAASPSRYSARAGRSCSTRSAQRAAPLRHLRQADRTGLPHNPHRPAAPALRRLRAGAGARAGLQRPQDHRMPRVAGPPRRPAGAPDRLRRGAGDRAHRACHGALVPGRQVGRGQVALARCRPQAPINRRWRRRCSGRSRPASRS